MPSLHSMNRLAIATLVLAMVAGRARAETAVLTAVADAEIRQFSPTANFGGSQTMVSGALGVPANHEIRRSLMRFNLSNAVPAGARINSATLRLQVTRVPLSPANSSFGLKRVLQNWSEAGVSWNGRLSAGTPWQTPGATGGLDSAPSPSSSVPVTGLGSYVFPSTSQLVADVQAWVNDPTANFGWLLISADEISFRTARVFAARENRSSAPVLTINYSNPPPQIVVQPQSQSVVEGSAAVFSVTIAGVPPLSCQWQRNNQNITDATNTTLVLASVQAGDQGDYTVIVRNAGGTVVSQPATLTVEPLILTLPTVDFISPTNDARFAAGSDVRLSVTASSSNGIIDSVQFLVGTNLAGIVTQAPFEFVLTNLVAGEYQVLARATDVRGISNTASVVFSVIAPPGIALVTPANDQRFPLGTNVTVEASVSGAGNTISQVVFLANGNGIGQASSSPYRFQWTPAAAGEFVLKGIATDTFGQSGTSAPVAIRVFIPESVPPSVTITQAPRNFARLPAPQVFIAGTARDNIGLDRVEIQLNGGGFQRVDGTVSWSTNLVLQAGQNVLRVRSVDLAGNVSPLATRFVTYVANDFLIVQIEGQGSVTPDLNGRPLEIGKSFRMRAKPGPGYLFAGWSGVPSQGPLLSFVMQSNLVIKAQFVPNPFLAAQGLYIGLLQSTNIPVRAGTGLLQIRVAESGMFTGLALLGGMRSQFTGQFDTNGDSHAVILRPSQPPLAMDLHLGLVDGSLAGSITDGTWASGIYGERAAIGLPAAILPASGLSVALTAEASSSPAAVMTAKAATSGGVRFTGVTAGGQKFTAGTAMWADGSVPFYLSLSNGEAMAGRLKFATAEPRVSGEVQWFTSGTNPFLVFLEAAAFSREPNSSSILLSR